MTLHIRLLGAFEARLASGAPIVFATKKERALLAYLAVQPGRPRSRDELAGLLWSSRGDDQARGSLRRTLSDLRKALGDPAGLTSDGDMVALAPDGIDVDVAAFERLAASEDAAALEEAAARYPGELLAGFTLREQPFEDWLRTERERLRTLALNVTARLIALYTQAEVPERAIDAARRLLSIDPAHEPTHRALMTLFARLGRRSEALRQYAACRDALMRELGVEPDRATEALHRELQNAGRAPAQETTDDDAPPLPDKPSIAVLPFANMTNDPEHEFFADGLTEDIIAALSRISALWVTARNSTFTYKGKTIELKQVARDLGVRYVMEGSVRQSSDRLRVTARLADAISGHEVWSERYDRPLADLFDIQDDITRSVAASTDTQIQMAEGRLIAEMQRGDLPAKGLRARDLVARAWSRIHDQTPDAIDEAEDLVRRAKSLDPSYPGILRMEANVLLSRLWFGEVAHNAENTARALELSRLALRQAPRDELAHLGMAWAWAYAATDRLEDAIAECERGLEINPNCSLILANLGVYLAALGRSEESIEKASWPYGSIHAIHQTSGVTMASPSPSLRPGMMPRHWRTAGASRDRAGMCRAASSGQRRRRPSTTCKKRA